MKTYLENIQWCIDRHRATNHYYDKYLPYEFHLRMVVQVLQDFEHLLDCDSDSKYREVIALSCYGHDLIEDTRVSFNECVERLGTTCAEIIYAVTNEKGKDRSERASANYYLGIRAIKEAVFIKLCDRIANVQYSKMTKSSMFDRYKKENENFQKMMGRHTEYKMYEEMFLYLDKLFSE